MTTTLNKTELEQIVGGNELRVLHNPNLSEDFVESIEEVVTPSMTSENSPTHQYSLNAIIDSIENGYISITDTDSKVLKAVLQLGYHYIEV